MSAEATHLRGEVEDGAHERGGPLALEDPCELSKTLDPDSDQEEPQRERVDVVWHMSAGHRQHAPPRADGQNNADSAEKGQRCPAERDHERRSEPEREPLLLLLALRARALRL